MRDDETSAECTSGYPLLRPPVAASTMPSTARTTARFTDVIASVTTDILSGPATCTSNAQADENRSDNRANREQRRGGHVVGAGGALRWVGRRC